ncbi:SDR family oxidoreductase [Tomitella gaofuii]|uniref:SDR family oxidoreductase n=1 Tax=Tomitella gaofuii TaxID=2760083 RepID=UPI0015FA93BA|nr:SDR family oxidoreductase [Tomitella gaofuii]
MASDHPASRTGGPASGAGPGGPAAHEELARGVDATTEQQRADQQRADGAAGRRRTAVVTGASSGIGEACARALAAQGFDVVLGARRTDRIDAIAAEIGGRAHRLDITDQDSVDAFAAAAGPVDVLVNNAGGAKGLAPVAEADLDDWRWMWETNVLGTLRVTKALLPRLIDSGDGLVVTVTSVAALSSYDGGAGYTSAKHAQALLHRTMRGELLGKPVRFTEICPGMVETEFSLVRFKGDAERADNVYAGVTPLVAEDIADIVVFAATRPSHVDLDQIVVRPRDQAHDGRVNRRI